LNVLAALKTDKDLDAAVNSLDADQQDILMKYPFFQLFILVLFLYLHPAFMETKQLIME
jgi:hypothetical protein